MVTAPVPVTSQPMQESPDVMRQSPSRRSRPQRRSGSRALSLMLAGPLLVSLAACGAGRDAQTYQTRTAADAANTSVGAVEIRNLRISPPVVGDVYAEGSNALAVLTLTSNDAQSDTLVEVSSPVAGEVVATLEGRTGPVVVPPQGSTGNVARLELRELTGELRTGQNVPVTLRFARAGRVEVAVPVGLTGVSDRPVYTGGEGEEGEPALGGPGGGHGEEEAGEEAVGEQAGGEEGGEGG